MTVMNLPNQSQLTKRFTGYVGWLLPAALLALMPKCLLCLTAYAGLGAALGLGGPEICGASSGTMGPWVWSLALGGLVLGVLSYYARRRRRR